MTRRSGRITEARRLAQPPVATFALSDHVYRAISIYPSLFLAEAGVHPNQITGAWIVLGLAALIPLASPNYGLQLAGALLLQVSYLLDFVDGEVARLQARTSRRGLLLDLVGHGLLKTGLFLAIGYGTVVATGKLEPLLGSVIACIGIANIQMLPFYAHAAGVSALPSSLGMAGAPAGMIRIRQIASAIPLLFESPGLYGVILAGAVLGVMPWVVFVYGILGPLWFMYRLLRLRHEPVTAQNVVASVPHHPPAYRH